jgi:hypothetical protein
MKLYRCRINLGGSRDNQVWRDNVSAPELMLLRALHDDEHVTEIAEIGEEERDHAEERERLDKEYPGENCRKEIVALFGRPHVPLPESVSLLPGTEAKLPVPKRGPGRPAKQPDMAA